MQGGAKGPGKQFHLLASLYVKKKKKPINFIEIVFYFIYFRDFLHFTMYWCICSSGFENKNIWRTTTRGLFGIWLLIELIEFFFKKNWSTISISETEQLGFPWLFFASHFCDSMLSVKAFWWESLSLSGFKKSC